MLCDTTEILMPCLDLVAIGKAAATQLDAHVHMIKKIPKACTAVTPAGSKETVSVSR